MFKKKNTEITPTPQATTSVSAEVCFRANAGYV